MLITRTHLASCDDFYEALLSAHQGLSLEESHAMNARLVLLLCNHIGDMDVLAQALRIARGRPPELEPAAPAVDAPQAVAPATRAR